MYKIISLFITLIFILNIRTATGEESFNDFLKEQNQEFDQYAKEIEEEFQEYKKIIEEEYKNYRESILKHWTTAEISSPKKWVEYSRDKKIKKVVDFEKGEIKIDIIVDKKKGLNKGELQKTLTDLLNEDKRTAFQRDELANNIEKRVIKKVKHIKTDEIKKESVLISIVGSKPDQSEKKIEKRASEMLKDKKTETMPSKHKDKKVISVKIKLPSKHMLIRAKHYKPVVTGFAGKRKLDPSLVFALIHTESAFNPMARSYVPAYGLMQIVPRSAGKDATELLYGKQVLLAPSFLYNDKNNIEIGTAYLYLLFYRYFKNVKDLESRLYCSISAYNTGPGNVARAFTGKTSLKKAQKVINSMTPNQVYNTLRKKLPHDETRKYLKRVSERINLYKSL